MLLRSPVNDQVGANWPEQHGVISQIGACVANTRIACEHVKCIEEFFNPAISSVDIVLCDVFPNFIQIPVGPRAQDIIFHSLPLLRSRDFCFNRRLAAVGSIFFPRSSAASLNPSSRLNSVICAARARSCSSRSRSASRTTSLADVYRPELSFPATNLSSSGVSDTFIGTTPESIMPSFDKICQSLSLSRFVRGVH